MHELNFIPPDANRTTRASIAVFLCVLALFCAMVCTPAAADEDDDGAGQRVFKIVSPSTVFIHYESSWGSGFVLEAGGLILTNRHVIEGGLKMKVKAMVTRMSKAQSEELDGTVVGIHQNLDLALVQVDLKGGKLAPVTLNPNAAKPDLPAFAIGSPDFHNQAMENTITAGKVLDTDVRSPDLPGAYLRTDVPVNPGNSGGPLCGTDGRVIGVITLKGMDGERRGYALPVDKFNRKEFIAPRTPLDSIAPTTGGRPLFDMEAARIAEVAGSQGATEPTPAQRIALCRLALVYDEDRRGSMQCAQIYARSAVKLGHFAEAAYCFKWAHHLYETADESGSVRDKLSPSQAAWLDPKVDGFSLDELDRFAAGKLTAASDPPKQAEQTKQVTPPPAAIPVAGGLVPLTTIQQFIATQAIDAIDPGEGELTRWLPEATSWSQMSCFGTIMLLRLQGHAQLLVFDILHMKGVKWIDLPEDALVASGGRRLVIYLPQIKRFQLYELPSGRLLREATHKGDAVCGMQMGALRDDAALVLLNADPTGFPKIHAALLPLDTFQPIALQRPDKLVTSSIDELSNARGGNADAGLTRVVWDNGKSVLIRRHMLLAEQAYVGYARVSFSGNWIFHTSGIRPQGSERSKPVGSMPMPVYDAENMLAWRVEDGAARLTMFETETLKPIAENIFVVTAESTGEPRKSILSRLSNFRSESFNCAASERTNRVVVVIDNGLYVRRITRPEPAAVPEVAAKHEDPTAAAARSPTAAVKSWSKKMTAIEGAEVKIADAPDGVVWDPATSSVQWAIPAGTHGSFKILVSITPPGKPTQYVTIPLNLE